MNTIKNSVQAWLADHWVAEQEIGAAVMAAFAALWFAVASNGGYFTAATAALELALAAVVIAYHIAGPWRGRRCDWSRLVAVTVAALIAVSLAWPRLVARGQSPLVDFATACAVAAAAAAVVDAVWIPLEAALDARRSARQQENCND